MIQPTQLLAQQLRMPTITIKGQTPPEQVDLSEERKDVDLHGEGERSPTATTPPPASAARSIPVVAEPSKAKELPRPKEQAKPVEPAKPETQVVEKPPDPKEPPEQKWGQEELPALTATVGEEKPKYDVEPPNGLNGPPLEVVVDRKDVPARTVFVDMEAVEGADMYEVQVNAKTQRWVEPYKFEVKEPRIRFRLSPGKYVLRTRSRAADGTPGRWGKWQPFWIQFRAPTGVYPGQQAEIIPKGGGAERVIFEWPEVKRAKAYHLRLFDSKGGMLRNIRTVNTWQPIDLNLNATYAWHIQPLSRIDEPDTPIAKQDLIVFYVGMPQKELRGIAIDVPKVRNAVRYQFEFVRFIEDNKTSEPTLYSSREPIFRARLEPGEYEMRVRSEFEDGSFSDWSIPNRFWIPAATPKLISPLAGFTVDPDDDLAASINFKWEPSLNAKYYRVRVWNEKGELIAAGKFDKTHGVLGVPHEQGYRWHVTAILDREVERNPDQVPQPPAEQTGYFKVDHYVRLNLSQAEEPSQLYAWGRYLTSTMTYQADNYDNNTQLDQQIYGGTGELAAGYWHRKTRLGVLGAAALSGFTTKGKTYTYSHASMLMGYRHIGEGPIRWRLWAGPAFHQTPEVLVDGVSTRVYFARIQSIGPELRAIYMRDLKDRWGMQVYASLYYGMKAMGTPNDLDFKVAQLYNLGIFGTYRLNPEMVGLLGYSYQVEQGAYQSGDTFTNGVNRFSFSGHFLSLTLQIGLEKAQR